MVTKVGWVSGGKGLKFMKIRQLIKISLWVSSPTKQLPWAAGILIQINDLQTLSEIFQLYIVSRRYTII